MSMSISILLSILVFILCLSSNCGRRTIPTKDNHDDGNGDRFVRVHKDAGNAVELLRKFGDVAAAANKVRVTKIIRTRCFWFGSSLVECRFVSFRFVSECLCLATVVRGIATRPITTSPPFISAGDSFFIPARQRKRNLIIRIRFESSTTATAAQHGVFGTQIPSLAKQES